MESRRLERLVLLLCFFAAITCAQAQAQATLQGSKSSPHSGAGKVLLETGNNRSDSDLSRRTRRIDPLDGLRKYEGGYNITNEHYWSSTIFTGRFGYIIAALWVIGGSLFAGFLLVSKIFFAERKERYGVIDNFLDKYHILSVICLILLAAFAIVASSIALYGAVRFHSRAESIKEIVGRTAFEAAATIYNITGAIERMENTSRLYSNSSKAFDHLNSTVQTLNSEAVEIQEKAEKNMRLASKGINTLEAVTISTVTLNLVAVLALLVARPLRLHKLYYLCIALCWALTALFWMYFGLYYFFDKFAGDTCAALEEYQLNPKNSTLGTIIPCSEKLYGGMILHNVSAGIHDIIDQVNSNIYSIKSQYGVKQLDYICNPFTGPPEYRYRPENCASGEATIGDIPQILKRLTCSVLGGGTNCAPAELSSAIDYDMVQTYTSSIQNVLDIFPGTERLVSCELVKAGFADIVGNQCAPLRRGARATWASLAALSAVMALLVLASAALRRSYAADDRHSRCIPRDSLDEHIVIHMDGVNVLAVNYGSVGGCQYPRPMKLPSKWTFNSYTVLKTAEQAPRTPSFVEQLIETESGLGEVMKPPEKSFWAKYWMYIIPLGLIVMNAVTAAANIPEEQAGGQGQPAAQRAPIAAPRRR